MLINLSGTSEFIFLEENYLNMKILFINPLDERSGTKVRTRGFYAIFKSLGYHVIYMESNYHGDDPSIIAIPQSDTLLGLLIACLRRIKYCMFMDYQLLIIYKFLPVNIPCIIVGKMRGKKILVDWDDLDSTYQPTWFRKIITRRSEEWIPRYVDVVTTHNHRIKEWAEKVGARKVIIVPQGIDTGLFDPERYDRNEIRLRLGFQDKKIICYMCSLDWGGSRDLDKILLTVKQVDQKKDDIVLLIIGGGILEEYFHKMAEDLKITTVFFTGLIPHESVANYLASSDLALIFMRDDLGNQTRFSLKLLEYLSMRKTVVGHLVGTSKDDLGEYCVLTTSCIEDFSDKIIKVLNTPPALKDAREYIVAHHDWKVVKQSIEEALTELVKV